MDSCALVLVRVPVLLLIHTAYRYCGDSVAALCSSVASLGTESTSCISRRSGRERRMSALWLSGMIGQVDDDGWFRSHIIESRHACVMIYLVTLWRTARMRLAALSVTIATHSATHNDKLAF